MYRLRTTLLIAIISLLACVGRAPSASAAGVTVRVDTSTSRGHVAARGATAPIAVASTGASAFVPGPSFTIGNLLSPLAFVPLKIGIVQEGIYRLTYYDIRKYNLIVPSITVATLGLTMNGTPVPIYVSSRTVTMQPGDFIEFYARPVNNTYTSENVYLLSDTIAQPARAAQGIALRPSSTTTTMTSGISTYADPNRSAFWQQRPNVVPSTTTLAWPSRGDLHWSEYDLATGTQYVPASTSQVETVALNSPARSGTGCALTIPVIGVPDIATTSNPQYQLDVSITDATGTQHELPNGPFVWQSNGASVPAPYTVSSSFPCSWLDDSGGPQQITLSSTVQNGVTLDEILVTDVELTYAHQLCASSGQLQWNGKGGAYTLGGFSSSNVSVWRLSGTTATRIAGAPAATSAVCAAGTHGVSFLDPSTGGQYFATDTPLQPADIAQINLKSITTGAPGSARYLIITAPQFASALTPLVSARMSQGFTVKVVYVNQIMDALANSEYNPAAIRAYIAMARTLFGTQYVLLAGGDTYDYHNYYGCPTSGWCSTLNPNNASIVPSLYVDSQSGGATPSDNVYATAPTSTSIAPQVAIGRFPAVTVDQMQTMVTRSIGWKADVAPYAGNATFVAGGEDWIFQNASDTMASALSPGISVTKAYQDGTNTPAVHTTLINTIDSGAQIVNFVGHGNLYQWSPDQVFTADDVPGLTNTNRPAGVLQWGCQTADYTEPLMSNLDTALLEAHDAGGNVLGAGFAVGSTGLDLAYNQAVLAGGTGETGPYGTRYLYGYLMQGKTIGQALQLAKDDMVAKHPHDLDFADVINSYVVLGDPTLTLTIPGH